MNILDIFSRKIKKYLWKSYFDFSMQSAMIASMNRI